MHLLELIVIGRVGDRGQVKDGVELFVTELLSPIECRQIRRDKIATISLKIFEIAGAKIVDHGQADVRNFFLQSERQVGADEAGPTGHDDIWTG